MVGRVEECMYLLMKSASFIHQNESKLLENEQKEASQILEDITQVLANASPNQQIIQHRILKKEEGLNQLGESGSYLKRVINCKMGDGLL